MKIPPYSNSYPINSWDSNDSNLPTQIDATVLQFLQQHGYSGSLTVVQNGQTIFTKGYGEANVCHPNGPDTTFRWDSITKLITATAILQLYEKRKLSLDDPVSKFLPEFKNSPGLGGNPPVTIRSLLNMTSGIAELPPPPGPSEWQKRPPTLQETMNYIANQPRSGQGQWNYSNSSYNLLAVIIGRISHPNESPQLGYSQYLQKNIFDPAGMSSANAPFTSKHDRPDAQGHIYENGQLIPYSTEHYPDWTEMRFGAGNINGSVIDFEKFDSALNSGKLISMRDLDLMQSQRFGGWDPGNHSINGHSFLCKGGAQDGEQSFYMRFPNDTMIFITANVAAKDQANPNDHIQYLGAEIARLLFPN